MKIAGQPASDVQTAIAALIPRTNATRAIQATRPTAPALLVDPLGRGRGRAGKREPEPDLPLPVGPPAAVGVLAITDAARVERSVRRRTDPDLHAYEDVAASTRMGLRRRASEADDVEGFE